MPFTGEAKLMIGRSYKPCIQLAKYSPRELEQVNVSTDRRGPVGIFR